MLDDGVFVDHTIGEGEIYSLPALVPHRNQRGPGSRGLVVHVTRTPGQRDGIVWYCEGCEARGEVRELHRMSFEVGTLVEDLRTHIRAFLADEQLRTCEACGWVMPETQGSM